MNLGFIPYSFMELVLMGFNPIFFFIIKDGSSGVALAKLTGKFCGSETENRKIYKFGRRESEESPENINLSPFGHKIYKCEHGNSGRLANINLVIFGRPNSLLEEGHPSLCTDPSPIHLFAPPPLGANIY